MAPETFLGRAVRTRCGGVAGYSLAYAGEPVPRQSTPSGHIADGDLQPRDDPAGDADWTELWRFALTIDGYERLGSSDAVAELANRAAAAFARRAELPGNLATLRLALFFEQASGPTTSVRSLAETPNYVRALVGAIGNAVAQAPSSEPTGIPASSAHVEQRFEQLVSGSRPSPSDSRAICAHRRMVFCLAGHRARAACTLFFDHALLGGTRARDRRLRRVQSRRARCELLWPDISPYPRAAGPHGAVALWRGVHGRG